MHEMSIACNLIDAACETAAEEGSESVTRLRIRVGLLSGVVKDSLLFSFELAAEGTACAGAKLSIEEVPVTVLCANCNESRSLDNMSHFVCPDCGSPTPQILTGQELDLISVEIEQDETKTENQQSEDASHEAASP